MGPAMLRLSLAALVLAILAPGARGQALSPSTSVEYVVLIDNTGTMERAGRGEAAVSALKNLVDGLRPGDRITVYSYGEKVRPVLSKYPVQIGSEATRQRVTGEITFTFDADRTDITAGMELAWAERERTLASALGKGGPGSRGAVILLTDGKLIPVYDDYARYDQIYKESRTRLRQLASLFGEEGIRVFTIGLGADTRIDGELLAELAQRGGGRYYHSPTALELQGIATELMTAILGVDPAELAAAPAAAGAPEATVAQIPDAPAAGSAEGEPNSESEQSDDGVEQGETAPIVVPAERALLCDYVLLLDDGRSVRAAGFAGAVIDGSRMIVDLARVGDFVSAYRCGDTCEPLLGDGPVELGSAAERAAVKNELSMRFRESRSNLAAALELVWAERERVFPGAVRADCGRGAVFVLTDGTEPADSAESIESERQRVLAASAQLGMAGVAVHVLALGDVSAGEQSLLENAAFVAGGTYARVARADGLRDRILDAVAASGGFVPVSQDPIEAFVVDQSVTSVTLVSAGGLRLVDPEGTQVTASSSADGSEGATWASGDDYEIGLIESPKPGRWKLSKPARVAVESALVPVGQIPTWWHQSGKGIVLRAWIEQDPGAYRSRDAGLSVDVLYAREDAWDVPEWRTRLSLRDDGRGVDSHMGDGIFSGSILPREPGDYRLSLTASGMNGEHSFSRVIGPRDIRVLPPWFVFSPPGENEFSARARPQLRLSAAPTGLCPALNDVSVRATVVAPDGSARGYRLDPSEGSDRYDGELSGFEAPGRYSATYHVEGVTPDGLRIRLQSETYVHDLVQLAGFFPSRLYQVSTGVLALLLGVVAVGMGRRQAWAEFFTKPLWREEQKVRGYLKPFYKNDGVRTARVVIGLENEGLPAVRIGAGTEYAGFARSTTLEFVGTTNGAPPTLHVEKGSVKVGGEEVTTPLVLRDGDVIEIEGVAYTYLRGGRS
jgi:hypothetical protein